MRGDGCVACGAAGDPDKPELHFSNTHLREYLINSLFKDISTFHVSEHISLFSRLSELLLSAFLETSRQRM